MAVQAARNDKERRTTVADSPGGKYESLDIDDDFCDTLKPTSQEIRRWLAAVVEDKGISECK